MEETLRAEIRLYEERERRLKETTEEQARKIRALQNAIHALTADEGEDSGEGMTSYGASDETECEDDLPEPIFDELEGVFRCIECHWEVIEGQCQYSKCGREHAIVEGDEDLDKSQSIAMDGQGIRLDRQPALRGSTPTDDIPTWMKVNVPVQYKHQDGRIHETYLALLSRGATPLMCERYNLEFTYESGIVAWADPELYQMYAGPSMQDEDFWKIYLGRRIDLDAEDEDGSEFMHDLLEEVLLFPANSKDKQWNTSEDSPGIWATRPAKSEENPTLHDDPNYDSDTSSMRSEKSWSANYARQENVKDRAISLPVKHHEEYDTADDDEGEESGSDEYLPEDVIIRANVPDAEYLSSSYNSEDGFDTESESESDEEQKLIIEVRSGNGSVQRTGIAVLRSVDNEDSSETGSDGGGGNERPADTVTSEDALNSVVIIESVPNNS